MLQLSINIDTYVIMLLEKNPLRIIKKIDECFTFTFFPIMLMIK